MDIFNFLQYFLYIHDVLGIGSTSVFRWLGAILQAGSYYFLFSC